MATRKILLSKAKLWVGLRKINTDGFTDEQVLQKYYEHKVHDVTVSEEDAREFYQVNPGIFGEAKFEDHFYLS